jgi:NitT/TauT family transport system substrate-binding protein
MNIFARSIAAACVILGCGAASAQTKLSIAYGAASAWAPALVAKDKGIFAKNGIDADLQFAANTGAQPAGLMANSFQVGSLTPTTTLLANEGGLDLRIVAGAVLSTKDNPSGAAVAREDSGIKTAADFRGKRIGIPSINAVLHVIFVKWLKNNGVDAKDVTFVEIALNQAVDLLRAKQIDGALLVEPFIGAAERAGVGRVAAQYTRELANPAYLDAFWAMRRDFIEKNPKPVEGFRASIREATEIVMRDPEEARKALVAYMKLPPVAASIPMPAYTSTVSEAQAQFWIDLCRELGVTRNASKTSDFLAP